MDVLLRRFQQPVANDDTSLAPAGPSLFQTPPHAQMLFPKLTLVGAR
jgi:hypothetical protein